MYIIIKTYLHQYQGRTKLLFCFSPCFFWRSCIYHSHFHLSVAISQSVGCSINIFSEECFTLGFACFMYNLMCSFQPYYWIWFRSFNFTYNPKFFRTPPTEQRSLLVLSNQILFNFESNGIIPRNYIHSCRFKLFWIMKTFFSQSLAKKRWWPGKCLKSWDFEIKIISMEAPIPWKS